MYCYCDCNHSHQNASGRETEASFTSGGLINAGNIGGMADIETPSYSERVM